MQSASPTAASTLMSMGTSNEISPSPLLIYRLTIHVVLLGQGFIWMYQLTLKHRETCVEKAEATKNDGQTRNSFGRHQNYF